MKRAFVCRFPAVFSRFSGHVHSATEGRKLMSRRQLVSLLAVVLCLVSAPRVRGGACCSVPDENAVSTCTDTPTSYFGCHIWHEFESCNGVVGACIQYGTCTIKDETCCGAPTAGAVFMGAGTNCDGYGGACCGHFSSLTQGCRNFVSEATCLGLDEMSGDPDYLGDGTDCSICDPGILCDAYCESGPFLRTRVDSPEACHAECVDHCIGDEIMGCLDTIAEEGACCTSAASDGCISSDQSVCDVFGGTFVVGTMCWADPDPCDAPPGGPGACCNLSACTSAASAGACSGTFLPGASCSTVGLCTSGSDTVGPAGGSISTPDGSAGVDFPAGCVATSTDMSMEWGNWPDQIFDVVVQGGPGRTMASYTFEPSGEDFCDTAELCMTIDLARSGLTASDCSSVLFQFREGTCNGSASTDCRSDGDCVGTGPCNFSFTTLPQSRPPDCSDPANATFCAYIGHFSDYGLVGPDGGSIPAVSEWGLMVLTLLLLVGAKVYNRRERAGSGVAR